MLQEAEQLAQFMALIWPGGHLALPSGTLCPSPGALEAAAALCPATAPWADGRQSCSHEPPLPLMDISSLERKVTRESEAGGPEEVSCGDHVFPGKNLSNRVFKSQAEKLKSKKQKQQANCSQETSLKGKGGNQYLIQDALICDLGTTFSSQFHPSFSGEIMEFVALHTEYLGEAEWKQKAEKSISVSPLAPSPGPGEPLTPAWGNSG